MKLITALATFVMATSTLAGEKSLCGADNRISDNDPKIGRIVRDQEMDRSGCSATLVGKRCAITAGHCNKYVNFMQFDVPLSTPGGKWQHPPANKQFPIVKIIDWESYGKGNDWMVLQLGENEVTGILPGVERGYYPVFLGVVRVNTPIRVTGYGNDDELEKTYTQQTSWGVLNKFPSYALLYHDADTTGGTSGSAIINDITNEIIGIHTHGGCDYGGNKGTLISKVRRLKEAIAECIALD